MDRGDHMVRPVHRVHKSRAEPSRQPHPVVNRFAQAYLLQAKVSAYAKTPHAVPDFTPPATAPAFPPRHHRTVTAPEDYLAIVGVLNSFGLAIDMRDWDWYETLWADLVDFDYTAVGSPAGHFPRLAVREAAAQNFGQFDATQHLVTNHVVDVVGAKATALCNVRAMHFKYGAVGDTWLEIGGRYRAGLERAADGWRIALWHFSVTWSRGNTGMVDWDWTREEEGSER